MSWDSLEGAFEKLKSNPPPHSAGYLGFYSSWLGGYFREPWGMMLPLDDHGFHRGDAVFEAARIADRALIAWDAHIERLGASAAAIGLELPQSLGDISKICLELARRANASDAVLRLYVTRGPGSFGPAPSESTGAQIFAAITAYKTPAPERYSQGIRAMVTTVPAKGERWSRIKSCNYLPNVMMKREAAARGFDLSLGIDKRGRVREGATENFVILTADNKLIAPKFDYTLRGTTLRTMLTLAEGLKAKGTIAGIRQGDIGLEDVYKAREAAFVGTTIGVLPVASLEDRPFASTKFMQGLHAQLVNAWSTDATLRTAF